MKIDRIHKFVATSALVVGSAIFATTGILSTIANTVRAQTDPDAPLTGWAWSDTIGWIDLNCTNTSVCGSNNFGFSINSATGVLGGYAWSENIGWISANSSDLGGCPSAPCSASISGSSLTGWLKAVSGGASQAGGWDGFIALNDKNTGDAISYGVTLTGGNFGGYAWGDTNVGWVSFALASTQYNMCSPSTVYSCNGTQSIVRTVTNSSCQVTVTNPYLTCVAPQFCSAGSPVCLTPQPQPNPGGPGDGNLTARPNLVAKNATTTVYWGINNVQTGSCTVTSTNGTTWSGNYSATSSCTSKYLNGCTSAPITQQTIFTLSCIDFDGASFVQSASVNLLPEFEEQ